MLSMGAAALVYAKAGWPIFPCHWPVWNAVGELTCSCGKPPGKGKGFCSSPGKHPHTEHGFYDASCDVDVVEAWWRRWPQANIGLRTGAAVDVLVLDVDPPHGGDTTLAALEERFGVLPVTRRAATGSGGAHILFKHVEGLSNCVGAIGHGLDIRTEGGYIVVAPSLHPSGRRYEWSDESAIAAAPEWLIAEIAKYGGMGPVGAAGTRGGQITYWERIAQGVRLGERHVMILKLAGLLVGDRRLSPFLALSLLRAYNRAYCVPPLPDNEVDERYSRIVKRQLRHEAVD